ncbi:MAG: thymidine kinase [Phycisphaerales bacterium]
MSHQPARNHPPLGRLEVVCGPMFAGKTTRLLERLAAAQQAGRAVIAAKPRIDTRYHPTDIVTHAGRSISAHTIDHPRELDALARDAAVLGLDEAHFFEEGLRDAANALVSRGVTVILAGLDRTSLNQPFGEMGALLIEADEVTKLTAPCAVCGRPAVHTVRLFDSTESIVVGGEGMFENRCRAHLHDPPPNAASVARNS